jgi:hypothetical protein
MLFAGGELSLRHQADPSREPENPPEAFAPDGKSRDARRQ